MNCNYCGQMQASIFNPNGTGACPRCAQYFGTCTLCLNSQRCEFDENPSPIPRQVQQVVRKGNMQAQVIVDNPERIQAFCTKCSCWDTTDNCCNRSCGTCGNYNEYEPSPTPHEEKSPDVESK